MKNYFTVLELSYVNKHIWQKWVHFCQLLIVNVTRNPIPGGNWTLVIQTKCTYSTDSFSVMRMYVMVMQITNYAQKQTTNLWNNFCWLLYTGESIWKKAGSKIIYRTCFSIIELTEYTMKKQKSVCLSPPLIVCHVLSWVQFLPSPPSQI
jgi:hypothetical protein